MDRDTFARRLARKELPSVLLFDGPEEYLKQQALSDLRKALLPAGLEELNETLLEAPETDAIIAAAETLPLMADRRLILLRDYPPLVGRAEADQRLIDYLPSVPASSVLLFYCVQKTDARKKLYAAIKKMDGVVSFQPLKDLALTSFVVRAFQSQGRACDERTADLLIFISGGDTARLLSEVAKIAALHPEEPSVSPEDVKALAVPSIESRIFSLTDAVVAGQNGKAFSLLRSLLLSGEDRVGILAMLLRQYRLLQHVKIMQYEKRGNDFIRQSLGVPAFAAGQYIRQAASYTGSQVKEAVRLCLAADEDFKTGRLNPEGGLETVMLKLLMLRKPAP